MGGVLGVGVMMTSRPRLTPSLSVRSAGHINSVDHRHFPDIDAMDTSINQNTDMSILDYDTCLLSVTDMWYE